jgi:hypothetical protein
MKNKMIALAVFSPFLFVNPSFAQYAQYNQGTFMSTSGQPVVVPPTLVMAPEQNSSKKSCKESVVDLFLFTIRNTSGDCTR